MVVGLFLGGLDLRQKLRRDGFLVSGLGLESGMEVGLLMREISSSLCRASSLSASVAMSFPVNGDARYWGCLCGCGLGWWLRAMSAKTGFVASSETATARIAATRESMA